ncbi:unnamed protein product [Moneuplotes crassus]|uniref:Uncharacterized protein n=1 Tax=Euplotes crassus TaxID=5936 RepID=A0AAD1ULD6_EUPCR|nr:unnamed protein product [Moneuplotes crassus]
MKVNHDLEYICRLENNLSLRDIKKRVELMEDPKLRCNSHSFLEPMKVPKLKIRDVYEKIVYETVRREKEWKDGTVDLTKGLEGQNELEKVIENNEKDIKKLPFGERKFQHWASLQDIHDFTIKKAAKNPTEEIKSESIRELIHSIKTNTEIQDHRITKVLDIIEFLKNIQSKITEYESLILEIIRSPSAYDENVVIFDGTKENPLLDYEKIVNTTGDRKASLLNKINVLKKKREAASEYKEIFKKIFIKAEQKKATYSNLEEKEICEVSYEVSKRVYQQICRNFKQFTSKLENVLDQLGIGEQNEPVIFPNNHKKRRVGIRISEKLETGQNFIDIAGITELKHSIKQPSKDLDHEMNHLDDANSQLKRFNILRLVAKTLNIMGTNVKKEMSKMYEFC